MHTYTVATLLLLHFSLSLGDAPYPDVSSNIVSGQYPVAHHPVYSKYEPESDTFSVQSGYEGYLIPSEPPFSVIDFLKTAGVVTLLPVLSKIGIKLAIKLGIWALGLAGLFVAGAVVTTSVCAVTPLCSISFLGLGFNKESVRTFISQDRINNATKFFMDAYNKYRNLNKPEKNPVENVVDKN